MKTHKKAKKKRTNVYNTASELYNDLLEIYFDEYYELSDAKRDKMKCKYDPKKLFLETYNYWSGLKIKNRLIQQEKVLKKNRLTQQKLMKNLLIYYQRHC